MKSLKLNNIVIYVFGLCPILSLAQMVSQETIVVEPETIVSIGSPFYNQNKGKVVNNGTILFYSHFTNDGKYGFTENEKSSYTVFKTIDKMFAQELKGTKESEFYDILFNNQTPIKAFELENSMNVFGTANFNRGIVKIDSLKGEMIFQKGANAINVNDKSHAEGEVGKVGKDDFTYPIGDEQMYRFAAISAPANIRDSFSAKYYFKNSNPKQPHSNKTKVIELINDKEYWTIERKDGESDIILTLSWDERTTPAELLKKNIKDLRILRYDSEKDLWVNEGGIVDLDNKTVITPTTVKGYGVFTLGTIKSSLVSEGDLVIYNTVTPNGDGHNDFFRIDNIEKFPNNTVEIYNRWGVKVFETKGYNSNGNVFKGISEGRVTINKRDKLPSGTYYYIINYEYSDAKGTQMIKKAGYIHLENN